MEDREIIALYWQRDEHAIRETEKAYGAGLYALSRRITGSREDSQECVSDTYLKAWNTIPPEKPRYFFAYLAKICRNGALETVRRQNAGKRAARLVPLTEEMAQCIPDGSHQRRAEGRELGQVLNRFVESLGREDRLIFLRRYWYLDPVGEIARQYGMTESKVKTRLFRLRNRLRAALEKEEIGL